jgi:hypothetical protein
MPVLEVVEMRITCVEVFYRSEARQRLQAALP